MHWSMTNLRNSVTKVANRLASTLGSNQGSLSTIVSDLRSEALFHAAEKGDSSEVKRLISKGYNPNSQRSDGVTPLVLAAVNGHEETTQILLKSGANPNLATNEGWFPYHFGKNSNHMGVATLLLEAHGGVQPQFDYATHFLSKSDPAQLAKYEVLFPRASLDHKAFFNIGSGNWRHPFWTNVDYASDYYDYDNALLDVPWDISLLQPLSAQSGTVELAYCSHTAEHLTGFHRTAICSAKFTEF